MLVLEGLAVDVGIVRGVAGTEDVLPKTRGLLVMAAVLAIGIEVLIGPSVIDGGTVELADRTVLPGAASMLWFVELTLAQDPILAGSSRFRIVRWPAGHVVGAGNVKELMSSYLLL